MNRSIYIRVASVTLAAMGVTAVPVIWGSQAGIGTMFNAPLQWIPRDAASRQSFNQFVEQFEIHEIVLVSWPGCTIQDERTRQVVDALNDLRTTAMERGEQPLFIHSTGGFTLLEQLQQEPAELSRAAAIDRLTGSLVGDDGQTSCVMVTLTEEGSIQRRRTLHMIRTTVAEVTGSSVEDLRFAGSPVDGLATDDASIRSLTYYSLPAILISLLLCWVCLRSIWLTLPILAIGAWGQAAVLATVYFLGIEMNAVLIVLPPLVFVLTVSGGVHLVNYFYDETCGGGTEGATTRALRRAWGPCWLAALTTAIGLSSLLVSDVSPVRMFGALGAIGVVAAVGLLFLVVPGVMEIGLRWARHGGRAEELIRVSRRTSSDRIAKGAATVLWSYAGWFSLAFLTLLVVVGSGLVWLRSSINVVSLLAPDTQVVQDFHWFERNIGPLVPVDVVLHCDADCTLNSLQRLELVRACEARLSQLERLGGVTSAATFFPAFPRPGGLRQTVRRSVIEGQIEKYRGELIAAHYLSQQEDQEFWRISARLKGLDEFDYREALDQLNAQVRPVLEAYEQAGYSGIHATYTGVTPVVYQVEMALLKDLFDSFLMALLLVTIVMSIALRSAAAGLVAMVPNIFPTLILFGGMGWLDRPIDIGTVMTASVALGMAVDGTFHFLMWYRQELARGQPARRAVLYAYRHCGGALVQATAICAIGLLVFAHSDFLPARHFAITMLFLLVAALFGDLVVLPTLLLSPLGRLFRPESRVQSRVSDGSI